MAPIDLFAKFRLSYLQIHEAQLAIAFKDDTPVIVKSRFNGGVGYYRALDEFEQLMTFAKKEGAAIVVTIAYPKEERK